MNEEWKWLGFCHPFFCFCILFSFYRIGEAVLSASSNKRSLVEKMACKALDRVDSVMLSAGNSSSRQLAEEDEFLKVFIIRVLALSEGHPMGELSILQAISRLYYFLHQPVDPELSLGACVLSPMRFLIFTFESLQYLEVIDFNRYISCERRN